MADKIYVLRGEGQDDDGQPRNRRFNGKRLADRTVDELLGVCKGMICDGLISEEETRSLLAWLDAHRQIADVWPCSVLTERITRMLQDGVIDLEERQELFQFLHDMTGGPTRKTTALPLTTPPPTMIFEGREFCLTGKFYFGTRKKCGEAIQQRGGLLHNDVRQQTHYLVLGIGGSTDWAHSSHGRKIEYAVELAQKGLPIAIVSEEHWSRHLEDNGRG